jgi:hypothetical protein
MGRTFVVGTRQVAIALLKNGDPPELAATEFHSHGTRRPNIEVFGECFPVFRAQPITVENLAD